MSGRSPEEEAREKAERYEQAKRLSRKIVGAERLRARLLEGGKPFTDPPAGWRAWQFPTTSEPIDEAIKTLVEKQRAPRLRGREDLFNDWGIACPYWTARGEIVAAFEIAAGALWDHQDARTAIEPSRKSDAAKLDKAARLAERLAEALEEASPAIKRASAAHPSRPLDDRRGGSPLSDALDAIATASRLPSAIEYIRDGAVAPEFRAAERAFASRMAVVFERLTGAPPGSGGGPFAAFLADAGTTAGFPEKTDWQSVARKIL